MSPRSTQLLHHRGQAQHLFAIGLVRLQRGDFGSEILPTTLARGRVNDRLPNCLRTRHPAGLQLSKCSKRLSVQPHTHSRHAFTVLRFVIRHSLTLTGFGVPVQLSTFIHRTLAALT